MRALLPDSAAGITPEINEGDGRDYPIPSPSYWDALRLCLSSLAFNGWPERAKARGLTRVPQRLLAWAPQPALQLG